MRRREFLGLVGATFISLPVCAATTKRNPSIGILWHAGNEQEEAIFLAEVRRGLRDLGYEEGRSITLVNTYAAEQYERFAKNAGGLVDDNVDIIVAVTRPAALAAQQATRSIPIVMVVVPDPVGSGLVASLARPGSNITGLGNLGVDLAAKRVELLREAVEGLTKVVLFVNPSDPGLARLFVQESTAAAERLGLAMQVVQITTAEEIDAGFSAITQAGRTGIILNNDALLLIRQDVLHVWQRNAECQHLRSSPEWQSKVRCCRMARTI